MQNNKINWYPGHMKKATDNIIKKINEVDFVIEVLDARDINLTSNKEILNLVKNKPLIRIALKKDLSDIYNVNDNVIIGSIKDCGFKNVVINNLNKFFEEKIKKLELKGLVKPNFIGMVIGIPNIGKSSLINFLAPKKNLMTANRAGVTKKQVTKKINDNYYLIDTPGVLVKNIESDIDGYKLSILNCIAKKVIPFNKVLEFHFNFLKDNYFEQLINYFNDQSINFDTYESFKLSLSNSKKFINDGNKIDENRLFEYLFNLFSQCKICKFHYK